MSAAIVCVVLDVPALGDAPRDRARALFEAGADWIQLRDRAAESATLFRVACALMRARADAVGATDARRLRVIVNRRADVARAAGADGVHLGFDALAPGLARQVLRPAAAEPAASASDGGPFARPIGRSLHAPEEVATAASTGGLDYVHLAPIWSPLSKPATRPPLGLAALQAACRTGVPVLAQGGIDAARAGQAARAGAAGVALTGSVTRAGDPAEALAPIRAELDLVAANR